MRARTHPGSNAASAREPGRLLALGIALAAAAAASGAMAQGAELRNAIVYMFRRAQPAGKKG